MRGAPVEGAGLVIKLARYHDETPEQLERWYVPADAEGLNALRQTVSTRPIEELLSARHECTTLLLTLERGGPSDHRSRALERMRALRWLTEPQLQELSSVRVL